jgi:hypothetical protein
MTYPVLGIVSDTARGEGAAPLLRALFDRCHMVAWHPGLPVNAILATSWRAPRLRDATREAKGRLVVWDDPADSVSAEWRARASLVVATPDPAVDVRHYRAIAPFMRERWRGRFGIEVPVEMPEGLTWRQQRTFLSLCPAVVATGTISIDALAFATPLVTDAATARLLGGTDGLDIAVCDDRSAAVAMAALLGADHRRAAAMGHAGRRLVEARHDLSGAAAAVAHALAWRAPRSRVLAHLADLPTPPLSRPITRAEARLGELSPLGRTA